MIAVAGRVGAVAMLALLCGCDANFHPPRVGDTACLDTQTRDFHVDMYRAVVICGTPLPDLTGDFYLQQYAAAWDITYRINPVLDAQIKRRRRSEMLFTGKLVPADYSFTAAETR